MSYAYTFHTVLAIILTIIIWLLILYMVVQILGVAFKITNNALEYMISQYQNLTGQKIL